MTSVPLPFTPPPSPALRHDHDHHWDGDTRGVNQNMYGMWSFAGIDPDG